LAAQQKKRAISGIFFAKMGIFFIIPGKRQKRLKQQKAAAG